MGQRRLLTSTWETKRHDPRIISISLSSSFPAVKITSSSPSRSENISAPFTFVSWTWQNAWALRAIRRPCLSQLPPALAQRRTQSIFRGHPFSSFADKSSHAGDLLNDVVRITSKLAAWRYRGLLISMLLLSVSRAADPHRAPHTTTTSGSPRRLLVMPSPCD